MGRDTEYDDDELADRELAERVHAALAQVAGSRSNQSIIIDNGKYIAVIAFLALVAGASAMSARFDHGRFAELEKHYADESDRYATEKRVSQGLEKTLIAESDVSKSRISRLEEKVYAKR